MYSQLISKEPSWCWTRGLAIIFKSRILSIWAPFHNRPDIGEQTTIRDCVNGGWWCSNRRAYFRFGATYVGTKQSSPTEAYPVLLGDIDPSGNLNANVIHQFGDRIRGKLASQVQRSKFTAIQLTTDYRGDAYTVSTTLGNPDIINGSGKHETSFSDNNINNGNGNDW